MHRTLLQIYVANQVKCHAKMDMLRFVVQASDADPLNGKHLLRI